MSDVERRDGRKGLGRAGEEIALSALIADGLTIVERNWRCARGELDIIAQDTAPDYVTGEMQAMWLVIVEVRTRRGVAFGNARSAVTSQKQAKLREVAGLYVQEKGWQGPWRIDAVAVQMDSRGRLVAVDHIRHAVAAE